MPGWRSGELAAIDAAEELTLVSVRRDGALAPALGDRPEHEQGNT
jgi:hypothetical protein